MPALSIYRHRESARSFYDPFGKFITPLKGWDSISVESEEWETARGIAIHFDATKNPRIMDGDEG
jgi:hypothetical protein